MFVKALKRVSSEGVTLEPGESGEIEGEAVGYFFSQGWVEAAKPKSAPRQSAIKKEDE